jgi:hypothetical protein
LGDGDDAIEALGGGGGKGAAVFVCGEPLLTVGEALGVVGGDGGEEGIDRLEDFGAGRELGLGAIGEVEAAGEGEEHKAEEGEREFGAGGHGIADFRLRIADFLRC